MQETRLSSVSPVPRLDSPPPSFFGRLLFNYRRVALWWRARRDGRGRGMKLRREGALVMVQDGQREIAVPHDTCAADFRDGIDARLETVAEKYVSDTGYAPREGDTIIDIGAGIGEFTLWCADRGARVVAFEPDPRAYACLDRNTDGMPNVSIFSYALWKERVDLRLHGSLDTRESSLIEDGRANTRNADVEAWPLDQLEFMTRLPVIDFMKIDGEGVEPEILAGAGRTLRRTRVLAVDVGAVARRPNLKSRVELALGDTQFNALPNQTGEAILALNTAMVGPFSNRALDRRGS